MMSDAILDYALIGHPVSHSLSPRMQQAAFNACGIAARYQAIDVQPEALASEIDRLRAEAYAGWNVTTPLKERIIDRLDSCTESALRGRSVNAVRRRDDGGYEGHDTDGAGLLQALRELWSFDPRSADVLVLGSGPAARSSAVALRDAGVRTIYCWSRNVNAAASIGRRPDVTVDLCVSALPPTAIVPDDTVKWIGPKTRIFDFNYAAPHPSIPVRVGGARSDGLPLLLHQGALSFEWWTGRSAPLEIMRAAIGLTREGLSTH